jgi:glucose/mannose-6-phosphate isomerase
MTGRVRAFPDQMREAWKLAEAGPDLVDGATPDRIYVVGMGGSAIGGDFLRAYAERFGEVPVEVVRGYQLPTAANEHAFAFFVSYSGGTEETLSCWEDAARRGLPRACITSGGSLAERATAAGVPVLRIPGGAPPRSALGWTSVPLLHAMGRAGLVSLTAGNLAEAADACDTVLDAQAPDAADSPWATWGTRAAAGLPVIYAAQSPHGVTAVRWACQINENGKALAHAALFPEQNHNEIVGWETPSDLHRRAEVALLDDSRDHPRTRRRLELVAEAVEAAGARVTRFRPVGEGLLARLYSLALQGDLVSLWVAAARGVDPTPVASIDRLKASLAEGDGGTP